MKLTTVLLTILTAASATADPRFTSWFTANAGQYARIYTTTAAETAGTKSSTWSRGTGTQTNPVYADINEIKYSTNWIYIRTSGLASHVMGPWYLNAAKTNLFPNYPSNTAVVYRIPRTPTIPTTKTLTGLGATGRMINGVSMFDSRDAFSYVTASGTDATPNNGLTGNGIWNRDGYHNEGVTFDPALAHQAGNNYHYHAQPIGLRHQLGDHVDYNATTNRYTESSAAVTNHSPILAWAADGLPVYGPYGYSSPMDAGSGLRRMVSGFALRNGSNGTTSITVREVLPLWAQRVQNRTTLATNQHGPAVNATYLLGHYIEDFDYRGDLGQTQGVDFDLNEQNVRFCVTPEFPSGTWAYFTPINSDNTPAFPYTTGRQYYGSPTGGGTNAATMNADTPLTTHFIGGANTPVVIKSATVESGTVTLTWSAVEGGTYSVDASPDQTTWTNKATGQVSTGTSKSSSYTTLGSSGTEYGRVNRTALATYDATGQTVATVAQSTTTSYQAGALPVPPTVTTPTATNIIATAATLGGDVTSAGTASISARGVVLAPTATNSTPQLGAPGVTAVSGSGTTGVFTVSVSSLTAGTAYTFAAYATSAAGTAYSGFGNFTTLSTIGSWRQTWYNSANNAGDAADDADPYGTGIENLAVYAFFGPGQNPATAKVAELPQAQWSAESFTFDFTEPANVSGITYGAQSNATLLGEWQSVLDTGSGTRHVFSVPIGGDPQIFMRLKVTSP